MDYIYENRAQGRHPSLQFIDRVYLDPIGCPALRGRRAALMGILVDEIKANGVGSPWEAT